MRLAHRTVRTSPRAFEPLERRVLLSGSVTHDGTFDPPDRDGEIYDHYYKHGDVTEQRAAAQPDGKIVIASPTFQLNDDGHLGHDDLVPSPTGTDFRVRRIVAEPTDESTVPLDPEFSGGGSTLVDFFGGDDVPGAVAVQGDGKIIVAGHATRADGQVVMALVRLKPNGEIDETFGDGGKAVAEFGAAADAHAVTIDSKGRIVVAGVGAGGGDGHGDDAKSDDKAGGAGDGQAQDFAIARFDADGSPDESFGGDGTVTVPLGGSDAAEDMVVQDDGKILLVGYSYAGGAVSESGDMAGTGGTPRGFALARLNSNGSPDSKFGAGGTVLTELPGRAYAVTLRDNMILVGGDRFFTNPKSGRLVDTAAAARYHLDGSLDKSYGGGDGLAFDPDSRHQLEVRDAVFDLAGGVVVLGQHYIARGVGTSDYGLVRFTPEGVLDASVGKNGLLTTDLGHTWDAPHDAVLVKSGTKVQAIGASGWGYRFSTVRYSLNVGEQTPEPEPQPEPGPEPTPEPTLTEQPAGIRFVGKRVVKRGRFYQFKVRFDAPASSAGRADPNAVPVSVTGPHGFSAAAERIKVRSSRRGSVALYRLAAPGGVFDAADDGAYTVLLGDAVLQQFRVAAAR